jgi:hypothetical protein
MDWIKRVCFFTLCCAAASAGPITITETIANASGSLDGTSFTSQTVTLVLIGDTSTIVNHGSGFFTDAGTATVSVSGLGSDTFTDSMEVFSNQPIHTVGIEDLASDDVLDVINSGFASYALNTSIGPLSGASLGNSGTSYNTAGGTFKFTSALNVDHPASFTASTSSVPEPGTLGLIGAGIGLLLLRRRNSA